MKIAIISNPCQNRDGLGDFLYRPLARLCDATHFKTGEETEGFDHYFYVDDGPSWYNEPKFHPATYLALDFVIPNVWYTNPPEHYLQRMRNFDNNYVFTSDVLKYCQENNVKASLMQFACDPEYHKPYPEEKLYDWSAVWHNCGERAEMVDIISKRFPNGHVGWHGTGAAWEYTEMNLAKSVSQSKCTLNVLRANMVNMRVYESMAIGVPLISQNYKDMALFGFVNKLHYRSFTTVYNLMDNIGWILDNPDQAHAMAIRAQRLVLNKHTYKHRAKQMLKDLGEY